MAEEAQRFQVNVRLSDEDMARLNEIATITGSTASEVVRLLLRKAIVITRPVQVVECLAIVVNQDA